MDTKFQVFHIFFFLELDALKCASLSTYHFVSKIISKAPNKF